MAKETTKTKFSITVDKEIGQRLQEISEGSGRTISRILNYILRRSNKDISFLHSKYCGKKDIFR